MSLCSRCRSIMLIPEQGKVNVMNKGETCDRCGWSRKYEYPEKEK